MRARSYRCRRRTVKSSRFRTRNGSTWPSLPPYNCPFSHPRRAQKRVRSFPPGGLQSVPTYPSVLARAPGIAHHQRRRVTMAKQQKKLGEVLVEWGIISAREVNKALDHAKAKGLRIGEALVDLKLCSESNVYKALASQH